MTRFVVYDLAECSEFRQALRSRPPALAHGAALLIMGLVVLAVAWAALVQANIVVSAAGRVRPVEQPLLVFTQWGTYLDGRVAAVLVKEGDRVATGQVMFRLDTARLDNEIAQLERRMAGIEEQREKLERLDRLTVEQFQAAEAKANAELTQVAGELEIAGRRRDSLIRERTAECDVATDHLDRTRKLRVARVVAEEEFVRAEATQRQAEEGLRQASLPLETGRLVVLTKALESVKTECATRRAELDSRRAANHAERDTLAGQLENLSLERERSVVRSPIDGIVVGGIARAGDILPLGKPAFEVAPEEGFRFEATVASEDVGQLKVGMPVKLRFDAYDYRTYGTLDGEVCFLSPDSAPANTDGETSKDVRYVVRVDLKGSELGRNSLRGEVKLGLGGVAEVIVDRASILEIILKKMQGTISFQ